MKLVLFVEGHTEQALPELFKRWLDPQLSRPVGIKVVHETEAWLLAQPSILPAPVRDALPGKCARPETVNFGEPPAKLLDRLYGQKMRTHYKKVIDGKNLFRKLDPEVARTKCPMLKGMLDDMLELIRSA